MHFPPDLESRLTDIESRIRRRKTTKAAAFGTSLAALGILVLLGSIVGGSTHHAHTLTAASTVASTIPLDQASASSTTTRPSTGQPTLMLQPVSGRAGTTVNATASNFAPNENVQFYFQGQLVAQAHANISGVSDVTFKVPAQYAGFPGQRLAAEASGQNSARAAQADFTITSS